MHPSRLRLYRGRDLGLVKRSPLEGPNVQEVPLCRLRLRGSHHWRGPGEWPGSAPVLPVLWCEGPDRHRGPGRPQRRLRRGRAPARLLLSVRPPRRGLRTHHPPGAASRHRRRARLLGLRDGIRDARGRGREPRATVRSACVGGQCPVRGAGDPHGLPGLRPDHEGDRRLHAHDHRCDHDPHRLFTSNTAPGRRRTQRRRHPGHSRAAQPVALHDQLLRSVRRQRHRHGLRARRLGAAHRRGPPRRAHRRHHHRARHRRGRPMPIPEHGSRLGRERSRPRDRALDPPGLFLRLHAHHFRAHLQHGLFAVLLDGATLLGRLDRAHAHRPRRRRRRGLRGLPHGLQEADRRHVPDHRLAGRRPPRRPHGRLAARALLRPARGEPASQAHPRPRAQARR